MKPATAAASSDAGISVVLVDDHPATLEGLARLAEGCGAMEDAQKAFNNALQQLRGEIFDLYPHALDDADLDAAVGQLVDREAVRGGFSATVAVEPAAVGVDDGTVMFVLRELLANVVKHAHADRVDVRVANDAGSCLVVVVRDDGRGFHPQSPKQAVQAEHFGLYSASMRLRALGGSLDIWSAPGQGTSASARVPIDRAR